MRTITLLALLIGLMQPLKATLPKPEPFDQAFARFSSEYMPRSEDLLRQLREVFARDSRKKTAETLEVMAKFTQNISADDIPGIQRSVRSGSDAAVATWLRRLTTDLMGFRRIVDQMLIENMASNGLRLDSKLLEKLKQYWEDESYFSWRFSHEADQRTSQANNPR